MSFLKNTLRLTLVLMALLCALQNQAIAEDKKKYTVSQKTYKALEQVRKLMDRSGYRSALEKLDGLMPSVNGNRYETALVYQHRAYVYLEQGKYNAGLEALEKTLSYADTLPSDTVQNLRYNQAQSAAQTENYAKAEQALDLWFAQEKKPSADAWYLRGLVQYKRQKLGSAATYLERAVALSHHENWTLLLLSIYLEQKQYKSATGILQQLVNRHPDKREYWLNLADVYLMQEKFSDALSVLQLARHSITLQEKEILKLARLYLQKNIPYSAAKTLSDAMKDGRVAKSASNLELLANSWAAAREPELELRYLEQAANYKNDGALFQRCAQILLRMERWREAVAMLDNALAKGLKSPGHSYLLKGIAAYQAGQLKTAANAFEHAGRYKSTKNQADQWMTQVKSGRSAS